MEHFVEFEDVCKYYQTGSVKIAAADHLNFYVDKGEFCIIVGPSGAGKTTLLNILGGMDNCDEGNVWLDGRNVSRFSARELTTYRRYDVGFVFQFYNLVQNLTALENVELASEICRDPLDPKETLRSVGLGERLNNFPAQLSGGEQQRVSIARALAVKWLTFWPSSQTLPSSQLSIPPRIFSRVVLPAPEGPTMIQNSPLST